LDDIPDTTWKTVIETNFNLPFHSLKKMTDDVLVKNGLDQELLKSDECAVTYYSCIFYESLIV
jgi:hypothetical protein